MILENLVGMIMPKQMYVYGGINPSDCNTFGIVNTPYGNLHNDFSGHAWSKSQGANNLSVSKTPQGDLHVHYRSDGLITGANLKSEGKSKPISNYEASMLDLSAISKILGVDNKIIW